MVVGGKGPPCMNPCVRAYPYGGGGGGGGGGAGGGGGGGGGEGRGGEVLLV